MENKKLRLEVRKILMESEMKESNEIRLKKTIPVPSDILQIKDIFKKNGFKLYVVGGAVRDALLGKTPKDYDLATDAVPDKVEEMMKASGLRTLPTGKAFGVINVFTSEGEYEVATFRTDRYNEGSVDIEGFKNYLKSLNNGKYEEFLEYLAK
jgi:tRNA nucleotidyltransferase/poly(A) polymerase